MLYFFAAILIIAGSCKTKVYETPRDYVYRDTTNQQTYKSYESRLTDSIRTLIKKKKGPYYPKEHDENAQIFIDTIVFNDSKSKMAFLVLVRNTSDKLLSGGRKDDFYYDGHCFIAKQIGDSSNFILDIQWLNAANITRHQSKGNASARIRQIFFSEFATIRDNDGGSLFKYNFDDVRFWDGPVWGKYFD